MKKCVLKDEYMASLFFISLTFTIAILVLYTLHPNANVLKILMVPLICLSILTIFVRSVFQKVWITEHGLETRFLNKVYARILWDEMTKIEYAYGRSMIFISLSNNRIFTIFSLFGNKLNFKRELYKAMPNSFADMKMNLILSLGGFKSRFKKKTEVYDFLLDSDFINKLGYLGIDLEDQEFIKMYYKDNLPELRSLIMQHYHIRFEK
jgi:hypothetical protein